MSRSLGTVSAAAVCFIGAKLAYSIERWTETFWRYSLVTWGVLLQKQLNRHRFLC